MELNLHKLADEDWYLEHYDGYPAFVFMTGYGFTKTREDDIPVYSLNFSYFKNHQGDWISLAKDHQLIGSTIVEEFSKDPEYLFAPYRKWRKNFPLMMSLYQQNFNKDLSTLSPRELLSYAEDVYTFYQKINLMPGFIDGFMFYADKKLDQLLKEFCEKRGIKNISEIYSALSAPVEPSFIMEEELALAKIAAASDQETQRKRLLEHVEKYSWIKSSYAGFREYTALEAEKNLVELANREQTDDLMRNKSKKGQLIAQHGFTSEILAIGKIAELLINWQDDRKVYTLTFVSLQNKILERISQLTSIDMELLKYCQIKEIQDLILQKDLSALTEELKKRQKSCLFAFVDGATVGIFTGESADDFFAKISSVDTKLIKEIRGMTASLGIARGSVRIINSAREIEKVLPGEILIAPMTRPEHLLGMQRASAIITDDGGITCHAAIVARELKKPCIIGTKIATKILQDGDIIEVNANKGTVTIIKRIENGAD